MFTSLPSRDLRRSFDNSMNVSDTIPSMFLAAHASISCCLFPSAKILVGSPWFGSFQSKNCDLVRCLCVRRGDKTRGAAACAEEEEDATNRCCWNDQSAEGCAEEEEFTTNP